MKFLYFFVIFIPFIACKNEMAIKQITNAEDYNLYLNTSYKKTFDNAFSEKEFWSKRLRKDSSGVGDLGPLSAAYSALFEATGEILYLKNAEDLLKKAIKISAHNKDAYTRSLAHNYISQHRFNEAKILLEEIYSQISNKQATEYVLFDVYMELGEYKKADKILWKLKNVNDYNYLIRLSKWNDYKGNINAAIRNLEQAKEIADSQKNKTLQVWAYTNLADFYGHTNKIKKAYNLYLKALNLQPDSNYAKKQIAWILYSSEKNIVEATRILDSVMINYKAPDYYLFKAQMAAYKKDSIKSKKLKNAFITKVKINGYGQMYNTYLIKMYLENNPNKALALANQEINNRATPETYGLLALAQLKAGKKKTALQTITNYVTDKTFKPLTLYYSAQVYKANDEHNKVKSLKNNLLESSFELGPIIAEKVKDL